MPEHEKQEEPKDGDTLSQTGVPQDVIDAKATFWANPGRAAFASQGPLTAADITDAEKRLNRFAPYIQRRFPETAATHGIIESPLSPVLHMQRALGLDEGTLYLKRDSDLPIAGSVKARGGIYAVLKHSEDIALDAGLIEEDGDYTAFASQKAHDFFSAYTMQVGSTGNLGLSIGIMSAALGYHTIVHMSSDARQWKKDLLRASGVDVREYAGDYGEAVANGRRSSESDPQSYFIDDERSVDLFLGYAVAAHRLQTQLDGMGIVVDSEHPLVVTVPCGVGGAPGGITYGLKYVYGDDVRCFFAEPTQACCMLVGMASGRYEGISVTDIGLSGITESDGLAVSRPSGFVSRAMVPFLEGVFTVPDDEMHGYEKLLWTTERLFVEPSAATGFVCPARIARGGAGSEWIEEHIPHLDSATHVVWATGGRLVPPEVRKTYLA